MTSPLVKLVGDLHSRGLWNIAVKSEECRACQDSKRDCFNKYLHPQRSMTSSLAPFF
jgi:hypothetical protein